jgi:glucan biosynthesis protein C
MFFLFLGSAIVFPLEIPVQLQFVLVLLFTLGGCLLSYEIIKRIKWVRVLFGFFKTRRLKFSFCALHAP